MQTQGLLLTLLISSNVCPQLGEMNPDLRHYSVRNHANAAWISNSNHGLSNSCPGSDNRDSVKAVPVHWGFQVLVRPI